MQVVGDHYRSMDEVGSVLCLRCHHLELVGGAQDKLQCYQRIASQDPASLQCGWEVHPLTLAFHRRFICTDSNS